MKVYKFLLLLFKTQMSSFNDIVKMSGITFTYGFVYCNQELLTGRYKIGCTYKYPQERLKQLNSTGMSIDLQFQFAIYVKHYMRVERLIHNILQGQGYRYRKDREFFTAPIDKIFYLFSTFNIDGFDLIYSNSDYFSEENNKRKNNHISKTNENIQNININITESTSIVNSGEDTDIEMIDTNDNPKKKRKYRKLNHFIKENTKIRHIIKFDKYNHIWKGIYYPKNDTIMYDDIEYNSLTKFANCHYKNSSSKKDTCNNPWKEIQILDNNNWIIIDKLC